MCCARSPLVFIHLHDLEGGVISECQQISSLWNALMIQAYQIEDAVW